MSNHPAYHRQILPPSGCSHALSVRLNTLNDDGSSNLTSHLITARSSLLQVWEVREFDDDGQIVAKLFHLASRRMHGCVTSLNRIRTLASKQDGADRILVSLKDAKFSLMEWTPSAHDLLPISLHTFEKLPQVSEGLVLSASDPNSRLAVLLLPTNTGGDATLAILPFFQEEIDLEGLGVDTEAWGAESMASIPYAPSHLLPLASLTPASAAKSSTLLNANASGPPPIRNVVDLQFLPDFNEPTLAILYCPEQTWAGRLENINHNFLVSYVTLVPSTNQGTSKEISNETNAVVIATSPPLPFSCCYIQACPPELGGLLVITANGILHLEQGGKMIGVAANGWFYKDFPSHMSLSRVPPGETTVRKNLDGSKVIFIATSKALVFTKSGTVLELTIQTSGRTTSSMSLQTVAYGVPVSCVERVRGGTSKFGEKGYVFAGSIVGECVLFAWQTNQATLRVEDTTMDIDDADDLYGISAAKAPPSHSVTEASRKGLTLQVVDDIPSYGSIKSMTLGLVDELPQPELVACTGAGETAGVTVFYRLIPCLQRETILFPEVVASNGIWSLPLKENNLLITSSASNTTIIEKGRGETNHVLENITLNAETVLNGAAFIRVTPSSIQLSSSDLRSIDVLSLDTQVIRAVICEPYVLVSSLSDIKLVQILNEKLVEVSLDFLVATSVSTLFKDIYQLLPLVKPVLTKKEEPQTMEVDNVDDLYQTKSKKKSLINKSLTDRVIPFAPQMSWLLVVDSEGFLKIYQLPEMEEIFSSGRIALFPDVLENDRVDPSVAETIDAEDIEIEQLSFFVLGETKLRLHILVLLKNGSLAVYEGIPTISGVSNSARPATLGVRFAKTLTRRLIVASGRRGRRGLAVDEHEPAKREFVQFSLGGFMGVFATGDDPFWLIAADKGPVRMFEHGEKGIYAFAKATFSTDPAQYVFQTKDDIAVATLPQNICYNREMPYQRISRDRQYSSIAFDIDSGCYVAGALFKTTFMNFDEEGKPLVTYDSPEQTEPTNYRSSLELLQPGTWQAMDGYEFRPNEFVSTVRTVSLTTHSTISGIKDFIAVGTTVYRAEDLASKGGLYLFEVVKVVGKPEHPGQDYRLKLITSEETKSVIGNVCDLNGYLALSMGQKLYVRALEQDEVLIAVGFLDVGVHVTSLQSIKNFLLIGDALQSIMLIALQEDPYKIVCLGRDFRGSNVSNANYLVNEGKIAFVSSDVEGILRVFEYDPTNIASLAGQRLLCNTEYHAGAEGLTSLLYAKRSGMEDIKQNGILYGGVDGSIYTLFPVRDAVYKRLQTLQTQLTRHMQHFAGLNPRGYRMVKNDSVSRAITQGILDGELLAGYEMLSLDKQIVLAELIGTDVDTTMLNLRNLSSCFCQL